MKLMESRHEYSIINFGRRLRKDKTAEYSLFKLNTETGEAVKLNTYPVPKKGHVKLTKLSRYTNYLVFVSGRAAGVAATHGYSLTHPFYLTIDAEQAPIAPLRPPKKSILSRMIHVITRSRQ